MNNLASFLTRTLRNWHEPVFTVAIALAIAMSCSGAFAQSGAGSIQGTITDSTGAVIQGAAVHAVNQATGVAADTKSNGVGFYQVPGLFTGTYTVSFTAAGMKTNKQTVELLVDQNAVINTTLTAGAVTQQVEVNANTIQLTTTDSGTVAATLENARINQLPLDQRLLLTLAQETTPGLEADGSNPGARANGLMDQGMEYVQDGATLTNRNFGGERNSPQGQLPDPDSVQEMKMDMSNSTAEFASPATGIITTKSGTNSIHGTLFETARNAAFGLAKGRGFVTTPTADADPPLVRNEFGFSAGGPLVLPHIYHGKDKTFWFASYERYSLRSWAPLLVSVPTQAMKGGDFSGLKNSSGVLQQLYDPLTTAPSSNCNGSGTANAYCRAPFPVVGGLPNQIPINRLSPFSKIIYSIIPPPTTTDNPLVTSNYQLHNLNNFTVPSVAIRLDHNFNEKNHAYLRYGDDLMDWVALRNIPTAPLTVADSADGIPAGASGGTQWLVDTFTGALGFTHVFSPNFYSETVVSQEWFGQYDVATGNANLDYETIFKTPNNFGETGFPNISGNILGLTGTQWNYKGVQILSTIDENLTKTMGRHELHFGGRYRHERFGYLPDRNSDQIGFSALATGLYQPTSGTNWTAQSNTGYGEGDFFLGAANNYSVQLNTAYQHYRDMEFDAYFQDNYHVSKNLTLNLGLRWEAHPAPYTSNYLQESFDLKNKAMVLAQPLSWYVAQGYTTQTIVNNLTNLGMVFETPQTAGIPSTMLRNNDFTFGPRIGAAYNLFGGRTGTVLRGAYGRYISPVPVRNSLRLPSANHPFAASYAQNYNTGSQAPDGSNNYLIRASNPVIAGVNSANVVSSNTVNSITPGVTEVTMNPDYAPNFVSEVNATLEQAFKGNSALRVSWVWTHATNLDQYYYYNNHPSNYVWDLVTGTTPPGGTYSSTATGPYDQTLYGGSQALDQTSGWSNDNALEASYQRLFHGGFAYQINYVWSKPFRIGGNWSRDGKLYPYQNFAPGYGPGQPTNIAPYAMTRALNRFENYMVDTGIPKHHIQFNGIYDLPFGRGKQFLGNSNRFMNELVGGFQVAGSGQIISQDFVVGSGNWGPTNPLHVYKHGAPITDCRSGVCRPSFLWFNGYLAPTVIAGVDCTTNCVSGLPGDYVPYQTPINNIPPTNPNQTCAQQAATTPCSTVQANYGNNNVTVPQLGGKTTSVAFSPGPSTNPFAKSVINGPFNYIAAASLFKVFPITERVNLRFNWDVFNVLNDQGYLNPNTTDGTENLQAPYNALSLNGGGQGPRVMQFSLRLSY
jgi:Carboxypeptidase regulatory-like domain